MAFESSGFRFGHAAGADWHEAARSCLSQLTGPPASLGFLYVTDALVDHVNDILGFFRERTGVPHWTGTVGIGICASGREYLDQPAIAVMMAELPSDSFQVFSGIRSMKELALRKFKFGDRSANFAIVHADPRNNDVPELISGMAGTNPQMFAAVKGGVLAFSKSLARSLAPRVRVNVIAPGWIETSFGEGLDAQRHREIAEATPLERWGTPEDVAGAAIFLASPAAAFITGQAILVGGGVVM